MPILYKALLKSFFNNAPLIKQIRFTDDYNIVILCGSKQMTMLQICLKNIYNKFENLPEVFLFTDFDTNSAECLKAVNWFPADRVTVVSAGDCLNYHEQNQPVLSSFARKNPMGLKLAALLQVLDKGKPVLYTDTDVIWYDDPIAVISTYLKDKDFELAMSEDFQAAYDPDLVKSARLEALYQPPYFCAGIMLLKNLSPKSRQTLATLLGEAEQKSNHFSEQTIFAYLNKQRKNITLDKQRFLLKTDDQFELMYKPIPGLIARHYIGPVRHLFWRDAFFLNSKNA